MEIIQHEFIYPDYLKWIEIQLKKSYNLLDLITKAAANKIELPKLLINLSNNNNNPIESISNQLNLLIKNHKEN